MVVWFEVMMGPLRDGALLVEEVHWQQALRPCSPASLPSHSLFQTADAVLQVNLGTCHQGGLFPPPHWDWKFK